MSRSANDDRSHLLHNSSTDVDSPEIFTQSLTPGASRSASLQPRQRPGYQRLASPDQHHGAHFDEFSNSDTAAHCGSRGLGILGGDASADSPDPDNGRDLEDQNRDRSTSVYSIPYSFSSTAPLNESFESSHKAKRSDVNLPSGASIRSRKSYADFTPHMHCASREPLHKGAGHHVYITLVALAVFSTLFSGLYLGIAIARPRYGKFISDGGNLTYSNAQLLFALFAKLIELSFVTVFIAFIGQVISRRAFNKAKGYGVTLAEISMRGWIMQPGQMIVHPETVKYGIASLMGLLAISAALAAMLYTTAANALVSPQLVLGAFTERSMQSNIMQAFGDMSKLMYSCASPVQQDASGVNVKYDTCVAPELAAQSLNDLTTWFRTWTDFANSTGGSTDPRQRPSGYSLVDDDTKAYGEWIEIQDFTENSNRFDRIVNNVSLAMPHGSVIDAVNNPNNSVLQPKANDGFGSYNIHASVPSPALNVICAEMSAQELAPLIYSSWPHANTSINYAEWANDYAGDPAYIPSYASNEWLNDTVVDEIFGFGPEFGQRRPPIFPTLPKVYNTIANNTGAYAPLPYRDAVYLLGGNPDPKGNLKGYSLCQIRAFRTAKCSTWFNATSSSSTMNVVCEDDKDPLQYAKTAGAKLPSGNVTTGIMYVDLADNWITAVTLNTGAIDGDAADARLMTQFFPQSREFDPKQPSMAEALAVMAGGTLLMGSRNASVITMTDQDDTAASKGPEPNFKANYQSQQYGSGAVSNYQYFFYLVLFVVFGGNVLVLTWLIINHGLITDFSDPANMFSLAINSPPSHILSGSCGCGPEGEQYRARWFVNVDGDHVFIENDEHEHELAHNTLKSKLTPEVNIAPSPIMETYSRLSKRQSIL